MSQQYLKYVRYQAAYVHGLHPEKDLNLPPLQMNENGQPKDVIDTRRQVSLARAQVQQFELQERKRDKLAKQHRRLLQQGKITPDDVHKEVGDLEESFNEDKSIPLSLMTSQQRAEYDAKRLAFINKCMAGMDKKIQEWRIKRHEARRKENLKGLPF